MNKIERILKMFCKIEKAQNGLAKQNGFRMGSSVSATV